MISFVYVIGPEDLYDGALVKIGVSTDVVHRLATFQCGSPVPLAVLWAIPGDQSLELWLHRTFADQRRHGEWFDLGSDPIEKIKSTLGPFMENVTAEELGTLPLVAGSSAVDDPDERKPDQEFVQVTGRVNASALVRSVLDENPYASDVTIQKAVREVLPDCPWDTIRKARDRYRSQEI